MGGTAGDGFEVTVGDIAELQRAWKAQEARITPMAGRLASMPGEIAAAANAAMAGKSRAERESIVSLAQSAQKAVNAALSAVRTLSGQLGQDADNLRQTADTYRLAELMTRDHIASLGQLASYTGPDAPEIRSLMNGETPQQQGQTAQQAESLAFPGRAASAGSGAGAGGSAGSGGAGETGSGGGADGAGYGAGSGSGGGAGAGGYSGTGTPVAPDAVASSAQVKQWVAEAIKILEQHGVPASKLDPNAIALIIQHESGGNPNAINLTDINAQEGHPSQGLMQTIPSTFSAYALPGHGNILNPVDNIVAGCQYAIARYGSLDNVPGVVAVAQGGSYVGY